jgi:hypothetical protein
MEQHFYQIDNITIKDAAIRAICRVAETYSPSFLVECAHVAGLDLPVIPGESKYFVTYDCDTIKKIPLAFIVRKNVWEKHVNEYVREPFKQYFIDKINNASFDGIEHWGINCYNMFRNLDNQYD